MKNNIKKILKFVSSRALYLLIGLFLAMTISAVYAAWNTKIVPNSSTPLTSTLWNDVVAKLVDLDNKYCYTYYSTSSTSCTCPAGETNKKDLGLWGHCVSFGGAGNVFIFRPHGLSCDDLWSRVSTSVDQGSACVCCKSN